VNKQPADLSPPRFPVLMKALILLALAVTSLSSAAQGLTNAGSTLTVSAGALLFVPGSVANAAGGSLVNAGLVQLTGDLLNAGTLTSTGTLLFSGTTPQTFQPGAAGVAALTLNNTGPATQRILSVPADLTVGSTLTLLSGMVRTAATATITLPDGASVTGEASGHYVQGNLRAVRHNVSAAAGAVDFSNGAVLNANGQNFGTVTVTRTAGLQTAGLSHGTSLTGTSHGIDRVWAVTASVGQPSAATPASVTLSWVSDDDNGFVTTAPARLWLAPTAAGPWSPQGAVATAGSRSFTSNITQLGTLTLSNTANPLPVELLEFSARRAGEAGLLHWATTSEKNNAYFAVESSTDGRAFQELSRLAGQGTTTQSTHYTFTDTNLARYAAAHVHYRLRQVNHDGTFSYSPVQTLVVPFPPQGLSAHVWPNPARGAVTLSIHAQEAGPASLQLLSGLGQCLVQRQLTLPAGATLLRLDEAADLVPGVYLLHLRQGRRHEAIRLVRE
jgi:hypothetical protein